MTQILYNLRTSDLGYRITKFTDGEVESSYLTSDQACDCPAGHRTTCRHRQMLPEMLAHHLANSDLFWDYELGYSCDINGNAKRETAACAPAEQDTEGLGKVMRINFPPDFKIEQTVDLIVPAGQHTAAEGYRGFESKAAYEAHYSDPANYKDELQSMQDYADEAAAEG